MADVPVAADVWWVLQPVHERRHVADVASTAFTRRASAAVAAALENRRKLSPVATKPGQVNARSPAGDSARYELLRGIEWPAGLTQLMVDTCASLEGAWIPPGCEQLRCRMVRYLLGRA